MFKFITLLLFVFISCKTAQSDSVPSNFNLPPEFTVVPHDVDNDEILALKYNNDMRVVVSLNMSKIIKKSALFGSALMKQSFETKFPMQLKQSNGQNPSDQEFYNVNENIYLFRTFDFDADGTPGYFEYGALYINEPEEYYEFFISGRKSEQEIHKPLIKSLIQGIK